MKYLKKINEEYQNPVLFEEDGKDKISYYPSHMSIEEISRLLHNSSVRKKMIKDFKENIRDDKLSDISDSSLGYALSIINEKKYYSSISKIRFGDANQTYNTKYK